MQRTRFLSLVLAVAVMTLFYGCGEDLEVRPLPKSQDSREIADIYVAPAKSTELIEIIVADFDSGSKPNNLNEDFGAWNKDPMDSSQGCLDSFDRENARDNKGYCLKLKYDVDSPNPAYNGFWMKLGGIDLNKFNNLVFYVKGDEQANYTGKFKVELKTPSSKGVYIVKGVDADWQKVSIPLKSFVGLNDLSNMQEFVIVFDDINATSKTGTSYIDDIYFE